MANGIVLTTLVWIQYLKNRDQIFRPLVEKHGLDIRIDPRGRELTEEELIESLPGVVATICANDPFNDRTFPAARDLRIIARGGVGLNSIDMASATRNEVIVTFARGQNADSVAEHTLGLMISTARRIPWLDRRLRAGDWREVRQPAGPLRGKTLGILGFGDIGRRVALRAGVFGMKLLAYDVVRNEQAAADLGVDFCSLEELAKNADFISCHLPLLPETKNLIDRDLLRLMKPTAIFINTSRGSVVNLDALAESLKQGEIQAAALDVFPEEPPDPSHPILSMDNAVLTPHMAGLGEDACEDVLRHCVRAIDDFLSGCQPSDIANPDVLEKLGLSKERK